MKAIRSSRYSLGGSEVDKKEFKTEKIAYETGDKFYLATDGFQDQFNEKGKKYMKGNFKGLLEKVSQESTENQKSILENEFGEWKGNEPQTDDVLIIGLNL